MFKVSKILRTILNRQAEGFTLMEMVVVLAVFSTTALMAVDLFLTITNVQRQVRNVQAVQSDARFAMESMVKTVKQGTIDYAYYQASCSASSDNYRDPCTTDEDCDNGSCEEINLISAAPILAVRDQDNNQVFYRRNGNYGLGDIVEVCSNNYYYFNRCNVSNEEWQAVTPSGVKVTKLEFYITPTTNPFSTKNYCEADSDCCEVNTVNCASGDCEESVKLCAIPDEQPLVTIVLETESKSSGYQETISLQTTVSSMIYKR